MDYISVLKDNLIKGYSKSDLERLIGLPKNNLSGIIKGHKKLSRKSELKIEIWEKSEKPHALTLNKPQQDKKAANETKNNQKRDSLSDHTTTKEQGDKFMAYLKALNEPKKDTTSIERRIKEIESELKSPPKNPMIGIRMWTMTRENELAKLKNQLDQQPS